MLGKEKDHSKQQQEQQQHLMSIQLPRNPVEKPLATTSMYQSVFLGQAAGVLG